MSDAGRDPLDTLFVRALELPRDRRETFVADSCPDDAKLRSELMSLLEAHDAAGAYFDDLSERIVGPALAAMAGPSEGATSEALEALKTALANIYRFERELGGAGMSRIFVAEDLALKRHVVLKVLPPEMVSTAGAQRFRHEIELAAQLQHPHIVPLLAADAVGRTLYYTMPFVVGESLRDRLAREGPLPLGDALRIWRDVLDALAHAHGKGVIHRDVKPGNILLTRRNALVTDFGIAAAVETVADDDLATPPGLAIGTPAYMAPEQAVGERNVDQRVDVYQAGLLMYEMLAGTLPFPAASTRELLLARTMSDPQPLTRADAPEHVVALVMRCLRRHPEERPQSAEAVLAELDLVATAAAPLTPAKERADGRRVRRRGLYAAAGLVLAFGMFLALARQQRSPTIAAANAEPLAVAVLPLVNLSGEPADDALANGVTRELTSALARSPDLRVIPSTLAAAFSDRRMNVQQIADSLEVAHVLEGGFQRVGARLRMQLRLVDARDGAIRWAETYDREFAEVFRVQEEIARGVANALTVRLATDAGSRTDAVRRLPDLAAYEWYQRGMDLTLRRTSGGLRQALEYFERSVEIDSMYAAAHAGMAFMYIMMWNESSAGEQQEWFDRAQNAASTAVALDASDPQALAALGAVQLASRDYSGAEATFMRALALDPGVTRGHEYLARVYTMMGRPADQLEQALRGVEVDPLSYSAIRELALALATNDRCEESLDQLRTLKSLEPPAGVAGVVGGMCYASRQMWPEAIAEFRWSLDRSANFALAFLGYSLARAGRLDEAAAILSDLLTGREDSHGAFGIATVYAGMLDYDEAFTWLGRAVENNEVNAYIMHPIFSDLRADPRFERVRAQMGLGPPRR